MEQDAWTSITVRTLAFSVLPIALATLHVRLDTRTHHPARRLEVYLIYLFILGVGASGLSGFFGHIFMSDAVAKAIGWPQGNPFQQEVGFANLALAILGLVAASRRDGFREATVIAVSVIGVGATLVHVVDIVQTGNLSPGNSIQNLANLMKPALLIPVLILSRHTDDAAAHAPAFDPWRESVLRTAAVVTAVVGTAFGIGSSLDLAVPAILLSVVLAAFVVARSTRTSSGDA